jgi:hypothetical protein
MSSNYEPQSNKDADDSCLSRMFPMSDGPTNEEWREIMNLRWANAMEDTEPYNHCHIQSIIYY